ncbi:hypothetical protein ES703_41249 [subsurface metagenome]
MLSGRCGGVRQLLFSAKGEAGEHRTAEHPPYLFNLSYTRWLRAGGRLPESGSQPLPSQMVLFWLPEELANR